MASLNHLVKRPAEVTPAPTCRSRKTTLAETLALWVSRVYSPPIVTTLGIWYLAGRVAAPAAWVWALCVWSLVVVLPALYVVWMVCRGAIADLDVQIRAQRIGPYRLTALGALASVGLAWLTAAPPLLGVFAAATALHVLVLYAVTTRWKISLHTAAVAGLAAVLWHFAGPAALPLAVSVPLVAWARVYLRRHSPAQVVAGALTGGLIYAVALSLTYVR
jgi:membrane-associated phospholipid phosphatase